VRLQNHANKGFSMIEILVSLFLLSFVAVNITGLQKQLWQQQRYNIHHVIILNLATEKMEWLLSIDNKQTILALNQQSQTVQDETLGEINLYWQVTDSQLSGVENDDLKLVTLQLSWLEDDNSLYLAHRDLEAQTWRCSTYLSVAVEDAT